MPFCRYVPVVIRSVVTEIDTASVGSTWVRSLSIINHICDVAAGYVIHLPSITVWITSGIKRQVWINRKKTSRIRRRREEWPVLVHIPVGNCPILALDLIESITMFDLSTPSLCSIRNMAAIYSSLSLSYFHHYLLLEPKLRPVLRWRPNRSTILIHFWNSLAPSKPPPPTPPTPTPTDPLFWFFWWTTLRIAGHWFDLCKAFW